MPKIFLNPNLILRKKAQAIASSELKTPSFKRLLTDMANILGESENGVGLAAPQIGELKMVFIALKNPEEFYKKTGNGDTKKNALEKDDFSVFINPKIIKHSKKTEMMNEGCLSVPGVYGKIRRWRQVTLAALNENGNKVTRGAGGLLAQIFQHECDHLDGKLFIDNAIDIQKHEK